MSSYQQKKNDLKELKINKFRLEIEVLNLEREIEIINKKNIKEEYKEYLQKKNDLKELIKNTTDKDDIIILRAQIRKLNKNNLCKHDGKHRTEIERVECRDTYNKFSGARYENVYYKYHHFCLDCDKHIETT